jgi:hypothetical protein
VFDVPVLNAAALAAMLLQNKKGLASYCLQTLF